MLSPLLLAAVIWSWGDDKAGTFFVAVVASLFGFGLAGEEEIGDQLVGAGVAQGEEAKFHVVVHLRSVKDKRF